MCRSKNSKTHEGFIRKLANGTYQGCITVNGKETRKVLRDDKGAAIKEERAAKRAWAILRESILQKNPPANRTPSRVGFTTFEKGWENYINAEKARRDVSAQLEREYHRNWRYFAEYAKKIGLQSMEAVTPEHAKAFQIERAAKLRGSAVKKFQIHLRRIWKETFRNSTPFDDFTAKACESYRHANLTDDEVKCLLSAAFQYGLNVYGDPYEWESFFMLAMQTGLRLADCARFDVVKNLDPDNGIAVVQPRKIANRIKNNRQGDGCNPVRIPIRGQLLERAIESRKKALTVDFGPFPVQFKAETFGDKTAYLFPKIAELAEKDNGTTLNRHISAIFREAAIDTEPYEKSGQMWKKSFHSLRVYCVSKYGNAGMTIAQATAVFGWSTASMYAHYFKADDAILAELGKKAFEELP